MSVTNINKVVNIGNVLTGVLCFIIYPQSVENCVCVLHNLTYQLETEVPTVYKKFDALSKSSAKQAFTTDSGPIGCFSSQSRKIQQEVSDSKAFRLKIRWVITFQ